MTMLSEAFTPPQHITSGKSRYQMEVVVEWDGWETRTPTANGVKRSKAYPSMATVHFQVVTSPTVNLCRIYCLWKLK